MITVIIYGFLGVIKILDFMGIEVFKNENIEDIAS